MANGKINYGIGFNVDTSSLQKLRQELAAISNMTVKDLDLSIKTTDAEKALDSIKQSAQIVGDALEQSLNPKLGTINIAKFNNSLKESSQSIAQIENNFAQLGMQGVHTFRNLTSEIFTTKRELKESFNIINSMATTLGNTVKWSIASGALNAFTGSIQKAWNYTKSLDTSLNDIRIVTEKSADEMERFAKSANKVAKELGASTKSYSNASLIYYQQGLGESDVAARAQTTIKAANVTGQSAREVSEQLTAVWNGYKVVAEEAELYVDKLAAVAATTAADLEELSTGMSKVASAASTMGIDIDQLSAQLATIVSVTRQDANLVGTALKTIYSRMGDLKVSGVDEFGTSLGDVSGQMRQMGIEVLDQSGNLRDMGTVIEEVAAKWGTWTNAQQQAAAVAIAGKRQYNNLIALFENWDMYESALLTSQTSAGTLQKQQDIYIESLEAKLQKLSTSGERVYNAFFNSKSMGKMIDGVSYLTDKIGALVETIGGGGNLLLLLGSTAARLFKVQLSDGIFKVIHNLGLLKTTANQTLAEMELKSQYKDASDKAIKEMVAIKETELHFGELVSKEEKERFDLLIKQTAELHNQKDIQEKILADAKKLSQSTLGEEIDVSTEEGAKAASKKLLSKAEDIEIKSNNLNFPNEYKKALESTKKDLTKNEALIEKYKDKQDEAMYLSEDIFRGEKVTLDLDVEDLKRKAEEIAGKLFDDLSEGADFVEFSNGKVFSREGFVEQTMLDPTGAETPYEAVEESEQLLAIQNIKEIIAAKEKLVELKNREIEINATMTQSENALRDTVQKEIDSNGINEESRIALIDALKEYDETLRQVEKSENREQEVANAQIKLQNKLKQAYNNTKTEIEKAADVIKKGNKPIEDINKKLNDIKKIKIDLEKQLRFKQGIQGVTAIAGAFGQLLSSINMIKNIKNILSNDSLDGFEKFLEIATAIISITPLIIASYRGMRGGLLDLIGSMSKGNATLLTNIKLLKASSEEEKKSILIKFLLEKQIDKTDDELKKMGVTELQAMAQTYGLNGSLKSLLGSFMKTPAAAGAAGTAMAGAGAAGSAAGVAVQLAWLPITLIIMTVAAVLAAIVAVTVSVVKSQKEAKITAEEAYESAKEGAKAAKEEVQRLRDEYQDLLDDMDNLKDKKLTLDDLRVGTTEWKDAVAELNDEIMDLISKYPILAQYMTIDKNGVYGIEQSGWDELIKSQRDRLNAANKYAIGSNIYMYQAKNRVDKENQDKSFAEKYNKELLDLFKNNLEKRGMIYSSGATTDDYILELSRAYTYYNQETDGYIDQVNYDFLTEEEKKSFIKQSDLFGDDIDKLTEIGFNFNRGIGNTIELKYDQFQNKSTEELEKIIESLGELEIDSELKDLLQKQIKSIRDNKNALDDNQKIIDANTKALLSTMAEEKGVDKEVYTQIVGAMKDGLEGEIGTIEKNRENNNLIQKKRDGVYKFTNADGNQVRIGNTIRGKRERDAAYNIVKSMYEELYGEGSFEGVSGIDKKSLRGKSIDDFRRIVLKNADGTEITIDQLQTEYATKLYGDKLGEKTTRLVELQKELGTKGALAQAAYFSDEYYQYLKDGTITYDDATLGSLKAISALGGEYERNADSRAWRLRAIVEEAFGKIDASNNFGVGQAGFSEFTEQDFKDFSNSIAKAGAASGDDGAGLVSMLQQFVNSPEDMKIINDAMKDVDWTNAASVNEFRAKLIDAGIVIDETNSAWKNFINSVNNGHKQWLQDSEKVIENLAKIKEIASDLSAGDIISSDEFKELVKIAPEVAKEFIRTADGYAALSGGDKITKILKDQYKDLGDIVQQYSKIKDAFNGKISGDEYFNFDAKTRDEKTEFFGNGGKLSVNMKAALTAAGYNEEQIAAVENNLETISSESIDTSSQEYIAAETALEGIANYINQMALDVENGEFDRSKAQEYFVTEIADSWNEVAKEMKKGGWTTDEIERANKYWKLSLTEGLGFSSEMFAGMWADQLEEHVKEVRELEIDKLKAIEREIKEVEQAADKAFGKKRVEQLESLSNQQENYYTEAQIRENKYERVLDTTRFHFSDKYGAEYRGMSLEDLYLARIGITDKESDEYKDITVLIDLWEAANEAADAVIDAEDKWRGVQLEAFNAQFELIDQAKAAIKEYQEFNKEFANFNAGGNIFDEVKFVNNVQYLQDSLSALYGDKFEISDFTGLQKLEKLTEDRLNEDGTLKEGYSIDADFMKEYEDAVNSARDEFSDVYSMLKELQETWTEGLEELTALYEDQISKLDNVGDILSGSAELWKLVGRRIKDSSIDLKKINNSMVESSLESANIARLEASNLKRVYDNLNTSASEADRKAAYDAYVEAQQKAIDLTTESIQKVSESFAENIVLSIDEELSKIVENRSLAMLNEDWSRATALDERYLDEVNETYARDSLNRAFEKSIDETDNIAAQNKLKQKQLEIEEKLNKIMDERGKLSQAEIDRANAEYELTLKQIALEESQRTASKMKLVRDAQGNYTYQFVADQDQVAKSEEELAKAENDLYNLEKNQQKTAISDWFSAISSAQSEIAAAQATGDSEYTQSVIDYWVGYLKDIQTDVAQNPNQNYGEYAKIITNFNVDSLKDLLNEDLSTAEAYLTSSDVTSIKTMLETGIEFSEDQLTEVKDFVTNSLNSATNSITEKMSDVQATISNYDLKIIFDKISGYAEILKGVYAEEITETSKGLAGITFKLNETNRQLVEASEGLKTSNVELKQSTDELTREIKSSKTGGGSSDSNNFDGDRNNFLKIYK